MNDIEIEMIVRNEQQRLIDLIEIELRRVPKERYFEQRFDKKYICDLVRSQLKKRRIITQWNDEKLYEFCFNAIEYLNITLPEFRNNLKKTGVHKEDIARIFHYKSSRVLLASSAKYRNIRSINEFFNVLARLSA